VRHLGSDCLSVPQFPQLADADGETQPPALKCFEVKREKCVVSYILFQYMQ